ncbi:TPA: CadC family transcriptional regulator [Kluyvera ascorbata]|uniref:lysine decarboxylation/transport transcriptional activator CadC n=1 Tax=Kluyvera ascorbata TaxID=51288 RepID=UPI0018A34EC4|nr:lysine decarboxylation/transport transcriptional activator CadC [Kluyvera ascorbata]BBV64850.1 transcriptional regulator CadC [Klebsiella sp. STW0522-44]MDU3913023.1 lysine decarboxylation/transport transcriptional activator CadC [Kluyvera ascorbata]HAT7513455.1 CadC family transcriptional regulator [Kluyvera ascorbata]HDG1662067.1 lysine decarboxylation/transport transcriptional activator CadC [Kluyvera ascorbata]HDG1704246.1 lysine decarboxylation/transport transcriptional activator CadC 
MQQPVVRVGEWLVTPSVNQISRPGRQLTLEPRLIDLLMYFARHPGEVLSRDELIDNIWMRNIVTSHVVTQSISELRKSLRDGGDSNAEYIITVPKRGYQLTAAVTWLDESDIKDETQVPLDATAPGIAPVVPTQKPSVQAPATQKNRRWFANFWTQCAFLLSLGVLIAMVLLTIVRPHPQVTRSHLLLNPRDIDVRFEPGASCNNWVSQQSYAIGLGTLITTSLNTYSTFMVHDKTNYNVNEPSSSGKTLTISFVNQRHYRAQQCFMSVLLVDNADASTMLDKRYFVTDSNLVSIQNDLFDSLSSVLAQPWPEDMQKQLTRLKLSEAQALAQFYQALQLVSIGDAPSLNKASTLLDSIIKSSPDFSYAFAQKTMVDVLRQSQQPFDNQQLAALNEELTRVEQMPEIQNSAVLYRIKAIDYLSKGHVDNAYDAINKSIALEMSWLNYVLLGKAYEMKGESRLAADAYITAFNLRPGENTLYWIQNGVFQTSIEKIVPYLQTFLINE